MLSALQTRGSQRQNMTDGGRNSDEDKSKKTKRHKESGNEQ